MTKTTKALITSAAIAGLLAGTGAAIQASTVLSSGKASFSALQDQDKKDPQDKAKSSNLGKDKDGNPLRLAFKTGHVSNYDESKVKPYTLPELLKRISFGLYRRWYWARR